MFKLHVFKVLTNPDFFLIQRKVVPEGFSEKSCISHGDVKG